MSHSPFVHYPKPGWGCTIEGPHNTCAAWPRWWNLKWSLRVLWWKLGN